MDLQVRRVVTVVVCLLATLLLVAGCPKAPEDESSLGAGMPTRPTKPALTGEPIKVGAIFSVTGTAGAPLGTPEKETALMVEEMVNDSGGINGRPLKIIIEDDQSDNTQAATAAKKLIEADQVVAVVGPTLSGTTLAIVDTFEKAQVPLISCAASIKITQPVKKWVFSTAQPDVLAVARLMEYLKAKQIKSIAVLYDSNPFGKSGAEVLDKQAPENGIKIVAKETFESKDTDMTTQLTKAKAANPEAVICWGTNPGPAIVAKNMKQLKMSIPLFMSHGVANRKFIELAGDAAEGVVFPAGKLLVAETLPETDKQRQVLLDYSKAFQGKYGKSADTFGGHGWDALQLVIQALKQVGPDRAKLRDAIESTKDFVGISGVFNLSPTDHNGLTKDAFVMVTIKGGNWTLAEQ